MHFNYTKHRIYPLISSPENNIILMTKRPNTPGRKCPVHKTIPFDAGLLQ